MKQSSGEMSREDAKLRLRVQMRVDEEQCFPTLNHCEPTGPREARPDDRLREAIQNPSMERLWIASSHQRKIASQFCRELLAMTAWRKRALELRSRAPDAAQRFPGDAKHRPVRRCAAEPGPMHQPVARLPGSRLCAPLRYACPGHERWASMIASLERTRDRQRLTHGVPKDQWNVIELPLPKAPKWCFSAFHDPIAPKRAVRAALQACP